MIINEDKIKECDLKISNLVLKLESLAEEKGTVIVITSGYRSPEYNKKIGGSPKSWHCKKLAVDWYFQNSNVFKWVTTLYRLCKKQEGVFKGVTELEVCRGKGMQHFHIAYGTGSKLKTFTGIYR